MDGNLADSGDLLVFLKLKKKKTLNRSLIGNARTKILVNRQSYILIILCFSDSFFSVENSSISFEIFCRTIWKLGKKMNQRRHQFLDE